MKIETFQVGQRYYQAAIYKYGRDIDDGTGDCFTSREEAEADGEEMVAGFDPEWQKRYPGAVTYGVREYVADAVDADGVWSGYAVG